MASRILMIGFREPEFQLLLRAVREYAKKDVPDVGIDELLQHLESLQLNDGDVMGR